jgi:integral membrane sensor domain MASE1
VPSWTIPFRRPAVTGLQIVATAAAYFALAGPGMAQHLGGNNVVHFLWPAAGLAVAAVLLFGLKALPGIGLGSFVAAVFFDRDLIVSAGTASAIMLGALTAYVLLRRAGFRIELDRVRDAAALVFLAAIVAMLVAGAIRAGFFVLAGLVPYDEYVSMFFFTSLSSAIGVLVVTPVLLLLYRARWNRGVRPFQTLEAIGVTAAAIGSMILILSSSAELMCLAYPPLVWAAWRFGMAVAGPALLAVTSVAAYAGSARLEPFAGSDLGATMINVQVFNTSAAILTLFLAVAVTEGKRVRGEVERASAQIVDAVTRLDDRLRPPHQFIEPEAARHSPPPEPTTPSQAGQRTRSSRR